MRSDAATGQPRRVLLGVPSMKLKTEDRGRTPNPETPIGDGLPLRPAERGRATRLLDQQFWCWGRDIHHEGGDALIDYGFHRWRRPAGTPGCNVYTLSLGPCRRVTLWGFGLCYADDDGVIFLRRFSFAPTWRSRAMLPGPTWNAGGLPRFRLPRIERERDRVRRLVYGTLEWLASYEDWADVALGTRHRRDRVASWFKPRTPAGRIAPAWRSLATRVRSESNLFPPSGCPR